MKKVIVTGGAGFIGSHVVDHMLSAGHQVLVIDNFATGTRDNLPKPSDQLEIVDISIVSPDVRKIITSFQPNALIHLAAQMSVRKSVEDPIFDAEQNIIGIINILEALKETKVEKLIFSSTGGAIYGEQDYFPADESHPINPECPYGLSKRCSEMYINYYLPSLKINNDKFEATALRFGNVYGPRQNPHGEAGVVAIFSKKANAGEKLVINGDGLQTRDFVYVGDIVLAMQKVLNNQNVLSRPQFSIYNLGTCVETDINTISQELVRIAKSFNKDSNVEVVHGPKAPGEQRRSLLTADKFSKDYAWTPETDINKGLALTYEFFKSQNKN